MAGRDRHPGLLAAPRPPVRILDQPGQLGDQLGRIARAQQVFVQAAGVRAEHPAVGRVAAIGQQRVAVTTRLDHRGQRGERERIQVAVGGLVQLGDVRQPAERPDPAVGGSCRRRPPPGRRRAGRQQHRGRICLEDRGDQLQQAGRLDRLVLRTGRRGDDQHLVRGDPEPPLGLVPAERALGQRAERPGQHRRPIGLDSPSGHGQIPAAVAQVQQHAADRGADPERVVAVVDGDHRRQVAGRPRRPGWAPRRTDGCAAAPGRRSGRPARNRAARSSRPPRPRSRLASSSGTRSRSISLSGKGVEPCRVSTTRCRRWSSWAIQRASIWVCPPTG